MSRSHCVIAAKTHALLFHSAEFVFADFPEGQVRRRPGFMAMNDPAYPRYGDTLLIAQHDAFGTKHAGSNRIIEMIESLGVSVWYVGGQKLGVESLPYRKVDCGAASGKRRG